MLGWMLRKEDHVGEVGVLDWLGWGTLVRSVGEIWRGVSGVKEGKGETKGRKRGDVRLEER